MMKAQAGELRVKWKQRVHPLPCEHLNQELESGDAGYLTGTYHCRRQSHQDRGLVCEERAPARPYHREL